MFLLKAIWNRIFFQRFRDPTFNDSRQFSLLSFFCFLAAIFTLPFIFIYYKNEYSVLLFYVQLTAFSLYLLCLSLNHFGYGKAAKYLLAVSANGSIFMNASILGCESGEHLIYIPIILGVVLIQHTDKKLELLFLGIIPILGLIALELTDYSLFSASLEYSIRHSIYIGNLSMTIVICVLIAFFYFHITSSQRISLIEAQNELKAIFDNSYHGLVMISEKTLRIIDCNKRALELFGLANKEELIDKGANKFKKEPYTFEQWQEIWLLTKSKKRWSKEEEYFTSDHRTFWAYTSITFLRIGNRGFYLIGITDITEKKNAELQLQRARELQVQIELKEEQLKYRLIFDNVTDALIIANEYNEISEVNPAACKLLGVTEGELKGKNSISDLKFLDTESHQFFNKAIGEMFNIQGTLLFKEKNIPVEVSGNTFVYHGKKNRIIVIRNITERKKVEEHLRKNQLMQAETEKQVAEFKLTALRSHMNPHFIFNCLNSIQHFITENDKHSALNYLSKFSKLMRQILENSLNNKILLSDEVKLLEYYLELESLRFGRKFEYEIDVDSSLDLYNIEIPSLLIQPFVENAIIHGLLNKEEKGYLKIRLYEEEKNTLKCIVEDNGVGRTRAAAIKLSKSRHHISRALSVTKDRLEALNRNEVRKITINTIDLFHDKYPSGTKIEISIPVDEL